MFGIEVSNDTVSILFQTTGIEEHVKQKSNISEGNIETEAYKNLLSCQIIDPTYCKPALKPTIPTSYPYINTQILGSTKPEHYSGDFTLWYLSRSQQEDYIERQTSFPLYLKYRSVTREDVRLSGQIGFLPALAYPATIYQSLVNFNHVLNNLGQGKTSSCR